MVGVLGLLRTYLSWRALILCAAGALVLVAVVRIVLLATPKVHRWTMVSFGPAMLTAALAAVILVTP